jgi:hypothetical protein
MYIYAAMIQVIQTAKIKIFARFILFIMILLIAIAVNKIRPRIILILNTRPNTDTFSYTASSRNESKIFSALSVPFSLWQKVNFAGRIRSCPYGQLLILKWETHFERYPKIDSILFV